MSAALDIYAFPMLENVRADSVLFILPLFLSAQGSIHTQCSHLLFSPQQSLLSSNWLWASHILTAQSTSQGCCGGKQEVGTLNMYPAELKWC